MKHSSELTPSEFVAQELVHGHRIKKLGLAIMRVQKIYDEVEKSEFLMDIYILGSVAIKTANKLPKHKESVKRYLNNLEVVKKIILNDK